ncbi:hypothetical protein PF010_g10176 [Phytophthora fragariae]|nr:hypothetical protein PF010_g10176 [Phytophthora fragariae]KAE9233056.1 hypothetical protein PF004_g9745 [Phytophthora fragariae]
MLVLTMCGWLITDYCALSGPGCALRLALITIDSHASISCGVAKTQTVSRCSH